MRSITCLGRCLALLLFGLTATVSGYATHGYFDDSDLPVPYHVNTNDMPYSVDVIREAAEAWSNKPNRIAFQFSYQGTTSYKSLRNGNVVYMDRGLGRGTLGMCWWWWSGNHLGGFDIGINGRIRWGRVGFLNTAMHEFGHALGLSHSGNWRSVMNPGGGSGDDLTDLHEDDIRGASYLYPPPARPIPGTPGLRDPEDGDRLQTTRPTFRWGSVHNEGTYVISIDRHDGRGNNRVEVVLEDGISGTSWRPSTPLADDTHYWWWVRGKNRHGTGEWSEYGEFSIVDLEVGAAGDLSPRGVTAQVSPDLTWSPAEKAQHYEVRLLDGFGNTIDRADHLVSTRHSVSPVLSLESTYEWWVRGVNGGEKGPWSKASFTVSQRPGVPVLAGPSGVHGDPRPHFRWKSAANATSYELLVHESGTRGRVGVIRQSGLTGTGFRPSSNLPFGEYSWSVRAVNYQGTSAWSEATSLTLKAVPPGATTRLLGPDDVISENPPTFRWTAVSGATSYDLSVYNNDTEERRALYVTEISGTEYRPAQSMSPASYSWWIRPRNHNAEGEWSSTGWFRIEFPDAPWPLEPSGPETDRQPSFTWRAVPGATRYELWVRQVGGQDKIIWSDQIRGARYSSPTSLSPGEYHWWIRAFVGEKVTEWESDSFDLR